MKRLVVAFMALTIPAFAAGNKQAVIGSKHDLGSTGSGSVTSAVTDSCLFCHAPHNVLPAVAPLWDHQLPSQTYTTYASSTYNSGPQTPATSSSRLCLSCHDGTVAVGLTVAKGLIPTSGTMSSGDVLGTNLSSSHPVSMTPVNDGQLTTTLFGNPPSSKDPVVKLVNGKVECLTCHDPHEPRNDTVVQKFLSRSNSGGGLCLSCHDPSRPSPNALSGWASGAHATATNTIPSSVGVGNYGTMAANACSGCHGSHNNPSGARSLKGAEESACSPCHTGTNVVPVLRNVIAQFSKTYRHPTTTVAGAHDATEALPVTTARHAECADCHNSHAASAQTGTALPPLVQSAMAGVSGYDATGAQRPATKEYQICFKCHADSTNKPQSSTYAAYGRTPTRYPQGSMPAGYPVSPPMPPDQYNVRLRFSGSISHNITGNSIATTANTTLRTYMLNIDGSNNTNRPLTTTSQIYCTDCHNNDQARSTLGTGPNGPHGSSYPHLLQMSLFQEPAGGGNGNSISASALCNKCHNLTTLNSLKPHDKHKAHGCTTCHDPHGVIGGSTASNRAMINFDTAVVSKGTTYFGFFYSGTGSGQRGCYVNCHGKGHNPLTY